MTNYDNVHYDSNKVYEGMYRGIDYTIVRTNDPQVAEGSGYEYEFVLYVNHTECMTASELETRGYGKPPWVQSLRTYAEAYIDGLREMGKTPPRMRG